MLVVLDPNSFLDFQENVWHWKKLPSFDKEPMELWNQPQYLVRRWRFSRPCFLVRGVWREGDASQKPLRYPTQYLMVRRFWWPEVPCDNQKLDIRHWWVPIWPRREVAHWYARIWQWYPLRSTKGHLVALPSNSSIIRAIVPSSQ